MNARIPMPESAGLDEPAPPVGGTWFVVTQVKSERVVYFTDDPAYDPPPDADWNYVSAYSGALPEGMTLRNCWSWRFNGGVFRHAPGDATTPTAERLLDRNRAALLRLLNDKIDLARTPFAPTVRDGHEVRRLKLVEAERYRAAVRDDLKDIGPFPLLEGVAVARGITMLEAAHLVHSKAAECAEHLMQSERFREQLTIAIQRAGSAEQLLELRAWILDKVYPALSQGFKFQVPHAEPVDLDAQLPATQLVHEKARLRAALREIVNGRRASLDSDYVQNDDVRKQKIKLAQMFLAGGNPVGIDFAMLENYAAARGIGITEAAKLIVDSAVHAAELLGETEAYKDRLLGRIEAIRCLQEIRELEEALESNRTTHTNLERVLS